METSRNKVQQKDKEHNHADLAIARDGSVVAIAEAQKSCTDEIPMIMTRPRKGVHSINRVHLLTGCFLIGVHL